MSRILSVAVLALMAVFFAFVPILTSCTVNFSAPTDEIYTPARGVSDRSGQVDVLNTVVVSGTDGKGTVVATLVNQDHEAADTLLDVSVAGTSADFSAAAQNSEVPAMGSLNLAAEGGVTASDSSIVPGRFVEVRFSFSHAKTITVNAPVVPASGDYADVPLS